MRMKRVYTLDCIIPQSGRFVNEQACAQGFHSLCGITKHPIIVKNA